MDQIFDRLETLLKSLWNQERIPPGSTRLGGHRSGSYVDSDLDDAMDELDAFLRNDRGEQERLERERTRRAEETARGGRNNETRARPEPASKLAEDYRTLGLPYGAPMSTVKAAYKRLLKQHHPDRHGESPEAQKKATEHSARINEAYSRIEGWAATGRYPDR